MNVIAIVWISGNTYYVDEMDTEFYHSLIRIKKVFKTMYPKTAWNGELRARKNLLLMPITHLANHTSELLFYLAVA